MTAVNGAPGVDHDVAVVGAGFSGIGAAIKLGMAGFDDYVVLEAGDGVGGAWHWNTYPGVAVDIPSFSYSFSFERGPRWSRVYAPGDELKEYAEHCVDKYDVRRRVRLNTKVVACEFDEQRHVWTLTTEAGEEITSRFVIGATGVFSKPQSPDVPGLGDFTGKTMHTARWDHDHDLAGERVAVIGTGASAVQVIPAIAPLVEHLTVFQRTPIWVLPKPDGRISGRARMLLRRIPGAGLLARSLSQVFVELSFVLPAHFHGVIPFSKLGVRRAHKLLESQVQDPEVRRKLTPQYGLGCKRPAFANNYLPAFNRANVSLETNALEAITATGVRTADGAEHPVDTLILATGFRVFEEGNMPPYPVRGAGGTDLEQWWDQNRYQAYQGVSVPGFPNMFTILGPYGYNGSSYFQLIENQMRHIVRCLRQAKRARATRIEVTAEANARYLETMLGRRHRQIFFQGTCDGANSYYFDKHGDAPFRSATSPEVRWSSGHFDLGDYSFSDGVAEPAERRGDEAATAA